MDPCSPRQIGSRVVSVPTEGGGNSGASEVFYLIRRINSGDKQKSLARAH
jgi:hypothetical protein